MNIRFLILFLVLTSLNAFADKWVGITKQKPSPATIQLQNTDSKGITISFSLDGFNQRDVNTDKGLSSIISLPGATPILVKTAPDLAKLATSIIIPDSIGGNIEVISSDYTDYQGIDIAPSKGNLYRDVDPDKISYEFGEAYKKDAFYPGNLTKLEKPYIFRDYAGQTAVVYPFQYNPVTKTLRVYHNITVEITFKQDIKPQEKSLTSTSNDFKNIYQNHFLNYLEPRYTALGEEGDMLIICYGPFMDAMKPFIDWKKSTGINVEMVDVSTIGNNETAINNYVADYYNKTKKISHLLLVGDHKQVNTNQISTSAGPGFSDNIYGYILGDDSYPEVIVGRFSAESIADVETQVERTINYERNPVNSAGLNHLISIGSAIGGGNQGDNDEADWQHQRIMRQKLLGYTYLDGDELYDGDHEGNDKAGNPNATMVSDAINKGAGLLLYTGHGSNQSFMTSEFSSGDISKLSNTNCLPFVISVACVNGQFAYDKCFAEYWLRSTKNGKPIGAVATIMSTISQSWDPPMCAQDEMVNIITESNISNKKYTFGGIAINGMLKMLDNYGRRGEEIIDTWTIFGDPSLMVRTDEALPIIAVCPTSIITGESKIEISCNVENAKVCLTKDGDIIGVAKVINGKATFKLSSSYNSGVINVVITAFNYIPFVGKIDVINNGSKPYIELKNTALSDVLGDNDQKADICEEVFMDLTFNNSSTLNCGGLTAIISSKDSIITVVDNKCDLGNIAANKELTFKNCFKLKIADNSEDQYAGVLNLYLRDSSGDEWNYPVSVVIQAPKLAIQGGVVYDDIEGNNNKVLENGENISLKIPCANIGASSLKDAKATLTCSSKYITISNPTIDINNVNAGESVEALFHISVSSDAPSDFKVDFQCTFAGGAYTTTYDFSKYIGILTEDIESGSLTLTKWDFSRSNEPWTICKDLAYEGQYSLKSGNIGDFEKSILSITTVVKNPGDLSFYLKTSCESQLDYLDFSIDNTSVKDWSGNTDWRQYSYELTSGKHTLTWTYSKNYLISKGSDCAWIDNIKFPLLIDNPLIADQGDYEMSIFPNPVTNNTVTLSFTLGKMQLVSIALYNSSGQEVKVFAKSVSQPSGLFIQDLNIDDLPQGLYYLTVTAGDVFMSKKLFVPRLK